MQISENMNLEKRFKKGSETIIELPIGDLYQSQIQGKTNATTGFELVIR
jgi:hypothetical protein